MMVSFAFNYNVTVPFIDSDATLCLITSIFIKGGAGERGGRGGGEDPYTRANV